MKRVIFTVIAIMFLWVTCACATDGTKIHNGVVLGMSPAEVLALEQKNGVLYNSREYLESTLLEQPYTLLFFSYATDDTESAHYETYGKQLVEMLRKTDISSYNEG